MITFRVAVAYIVIPICTSLSFTLLSKYFLNDQVFVPGELNFAVLSVVIALPTTIAIAWVLGLDYRSLMRFRVSDDEDKVSELQSVITISYLEIIATVALIFVYYAVNWKIGNWITPQFFMLTIIPLPISVYATYYVIGPTYFKSDFAYHFARKSLIALETMIREGRKDEVKKIQYLMIALKWYNKFIKRKLKVEFDDARISSCILSTEDKNNLLEELITSFEINYALETQTLAKLFECYEGNKLETIESDKLKELLLDLHKARKSPDSSKPVELVRIRRVDDPLQPIKYLSKIANLPSSESFLSQEKLTAKIKEITLILAAIIPVLVTVLQFVIPILK